MKEEKKMVVIKNSDDTTEEVELITYLISEDNMDTYMVYSKGEITGANQDEVIYISKITKDGNIYRLHGISDDNEWGQVQTLLKKIANA